MGCAQSKCAGGDGGGAGERGYAQDNFHVVGREEKLPSFRRKSSLDSSLISKPSQQDGIQKPSHAAAAASSSSALPSVSYGSLAEHRKSASLETTELLGMEGAGREENGVLRTSGGGSDSEVGSTAVGLFVLSCKIGLNSVHVYLSVACSPIGHRVRAPPPTLLWCEGQGEDRGETCVYTPAAKMSSDSKHERGRKTL